MIESLVVIFNYDYEIDNFIIEKNNKKSRDFLKIKINKKRNSKISFSLP